MFDYSKLYYEKLLIAEGETYVAGVDEVGRGPLAGPVVCAAVIMPPDDKLLIEGIDDSKKLSAKKRESLYEAICSTAVAYSICRVEHTVIDEINILEATRLCMKNCVESLSVRPSAVITDGNMTLDVAQRQKSIVKGDALSYSIGAASIIAKVYRDRLMDEYALKYPQYFFDKNKGYGTKAHIDAIKEFGLCEIHRRTFTKKL